MKRFLLMILGASALSVCSFAQSAPATKVSSSNDTGVVPHVPYSVGVGNVNLTNGNMTLDLPLVSLSGRAGNTMSLSLQFDSKIWVPHYVISQDNSTIVWTWQRETRSGKVGDLGWRLSLPDITNGSVVYDSTGTLVGNEADVVTLPDGTKHSLGKNRDCCGQALDSMDGADLKTDPYTPGTNVTNHVIHAKDGTVFNFADGTITDSNGNVSKITYSGNTSITLEDTLKRHITIENDSTIWYNPRYIRYQDSNGATQTITLNYAAYTLFQYQDDQHPNPDPQYTVSPPNLYRPFGYPIEGCGGTGMNCSWVANPIPYSSFLLLSSIDLPDSTHYTFSYNGYGELIKITFPTGGYAEYSYSKFQHQEVHWASTAYNNQADFREVTSRNVCDGSGSCTTTTYTPTVSMYYVNNDTMDVIEASGETSAHLTRYKFSQGVIQNMPCDPFYIPRETTRWIYAGATDTTQLLRTVQTAYNSYTGVGGVGCSDNFLPIQITTTLNDVSPNLVTREEIDYDSYTAHVYYPFNYDQEGWAGGNPQSGTDIVVPIGNPVAHRQYDYSGSLIRNTTTDWLKTSAYVWAHLLDRKTRVGVYDGSGNKLSEMKYEYDSYTEGLGSSNAANHQSASVRGNVTAIQSWLNTTNTYLETRQQYDDAGNIVKTTDPEGHWTTFSFADNWANSSCAPATGAAAAYPTLVQNQLGHQSTSGYNSCTGTVAWQRDPNSQGAPTATVSTTYDMFNRPLTIDYRDGGHTEYGYSGGATNQGSSPLLITITRTKWPDSAATEIQLDGLGRESQRAIANGEASSGWEVRTTCYDSEDRVNFQGYPYLSSSPFLNSPCAIPGDTIAHDTLGRITQVTHTDGTSILTDYLGRATRVQDEGRNTSGNRVTRVSQSDVLGRLTSVCEQASATQMGSNNTPSACGQDIGATGFLTSYQYDIHDAQGTAMQVTQAGLGNRYFVYDSLNQLVKATNPESGTISYTYYNDGLLKTRVRPKPNQLDPGVVTTTTYSNDALHRPTETHYDDGSTPWVYRQYDQTTASGQTLANTIGHLTSVSAVGGQSVNLYGYDVMGRVATNWQCTPAICGSSFKQLAYGYDLVGNLTSGSNGFGVTIGYNLNRASRLASVTSSWSDTAHPSLLMSNGTYGAFGLVAASFGNGVNETRGYTSRGQLNAITDNAWVTQSAVPGSGSVTISGSERTIGGPPATAGTGSVTISGAIQSTQVVNQPAAPGSGTVNITGSEQSKQVQSSPGTPGHGTASVSGSARRAYDADGCLCYVYDSGTISIIVNGATRSATYNQGTSASNIAATLASNLGSTGFVTGTSSGGTITITATSNGTNTNYTVSMSQVSNRPDLFPSGSFTLSWANLTGGTNPTYTTAYDAGTVTATVNGFGKSTNYGQNSTTTSIVSGLVSAFNGDGNSPVTASQSGASLILTSKASGASTNYSLTASSSTSQGQNFSQPSFTATPTTSTLIGGRDATYNTLYDSGTVSITVNGVTKSTSYGQSSTTSGIASALALAFTNDGLAPVSGTASGSTVTLTSRTTGSSTNYTLSSTSSTNQGTYFSSPSFTGAPSGSTLTGGQDAGANVNDAGTVSITVNGFAKSTPYGQSSTASSLASALAGLFNGDGSSPVTASVSGGTVTLTTKSGGSASNYSLSASSTTTQTGFTDTSFPVTPSGGSLTGGTDSSQVYTTPYSTGLTLAPNGNVLTANDNINGNWTYGYDEFNRLSSASMPGASYTYAYDRYGNRFQQNGPLTHLFTFSSGNNRIDGYCYDAAGNLLREGACAQTNTYNYDAENRLISVGSNVSYVYDGDGRRIRKTVDGTSVDFFYDLGSNAIAEMSSAGTWNRGEVFAGGRHLATYANSTTVFSVSDWLGTERTRTDIAGAVTETCTSLPFGDGQSCNGNDVSPHHFTGKLRENETALDYFGARYYGSDMGRFTTADPISVTKRRLLDPQELNLYSYTRNSPLRFVDPDGRQYMGTDGKKVEVKLENGYLKLGANASADLKKMAALVAKSGSSTALGVFMGLAENKTKVDFTIATQKIDNDLGGLHQAHDSKGQPLSWNKDTQRFSGTVAFTQVNGKAAYEGATITMFEGNISASSQQEKDATMVSIFAHEGFHDLDQKTIDAIKDRQEGRPNNYNVEDPAYDIQRTVLKEINGTD